MFQLASAAMTGAPFSGPRSEEAIQLITRYPNLSEVETARLINVYRELPAVEVALMISDDKLAPKVERFVKEHRSKISTPVRQYAILLAIALVGLAVIFWAVSGS